MSNKINSSPVVTSQLRNDIPEFTTGSLIKVFYIIREGNKERIQAFEGVVIARNNGTGVDASFTVLKNASSGIKVTRTFPLHSPLIQKVEVLSLQRGRRSKLYYLSQLKEPNKSIRAKQVKVKNKAE
ncbi:MAG: 50S ribosomal protein L19 [Patescibacteria group bacterium]